jgi:hypothetical protein
MEVNQVLKDDRPLADPGRVRSARQIFPFQVESPAFYAAHNAHTIGCSDFDNYRYPDPALGAWIDELHRLLRSSDELERCRREHLSAEQYEAVKREMASDDGL